MFPYQQAGVKELGCLLGLRSKILIGNLSEFLAGSLQTLQGILTAHIQLTGRALELVTTILNGVERCI